LDRLLRLGQKGENYPGRPVHEPEHIDRSV
jgi:hypothetical protein